MCDFGAAFRTVMRLPCRFEKSSESLKSQRSYVPCAGVPLADGDARTESAIRRSLGRKDEH